MNTIIFLTSIKRMENIIKLMDEHPILYVPMAILLISMFKFYVIDKILPKKKSGNEPEKKSDENEQEESSE